ncbi:MAG: UvrD-helicase domain-containing protein [Burkholderiales bacterium]|nr:UvrD-helicase domain-containing protein [Burkholderiales bacterium]
MAAFYAQASFIENLGMEVPETLARLGPFKQHAIEYHFAAALARFWPAFEASLHQHPGRFMTFNRAFLQLGEAHLDRPVHNPAQSLRPFTHLLVDEFQDISPQIVSWLRANQRRLLELGKAPTLMAIGDDWQSIYGWRGSAPEYFIDFGKHFPASAALNGHGEYRMMENYRSVAPIIADAEKLLQSVRIKIDKQAKAMRPLETSDHGVTVVQGVSASKDAQRVVDEIHKQLAFVNTLPKADEKKVVVLSRTQKSLQLIEKLLGSVSGVKFYTFHGAKGLQGEVAILCDDCAYDQQHALRNAVYAISPIFKQSYDDASQDEALRLAYVAVTRGIRRVVWFLDEPKGAATLLASPQTAVPKVCAGVL